jgi:hypothetical protein
MFADQESIVIKEYKNYLVLTAYKTPKIKIVGSGSLLSFFNKKDVKISKDALSILKKYQQENNNDIISLQIIGKTNIWWNSHYGIIIPPNDKSTKIKTIPVHTLIDDNTIDDEIKKVIDNAK